ncbi:hypothetical protein BHM03_00051439 [Ensete ventricosum]|nr:hypothetical protein BHM03_00051439 [Ensete ventricosum]
MDCPRATLRTGVTQEWVGEGMIRAAGELDYFSAHIRLREPDKSEDKVEVALHKFSRSFPSLEGSARTNKDQHNSANPTPDSVIGELKQHGGLEFDYLKTTAESDWEPKGHAVAKTED